MEAICDTITLKCCPTGGGFRSYRGCHGQLPARYLLNQTAIEKNIPFFHGAVHGFEGRAMTVIPENGMPSMHVPGPHTGGDVSGDRVAPAVIGSIQATEVIKWIVGNRRPFGKPDDGL